MRDTLPTFDRRASMERYERLRARATKDALAALVYAALLFAYFWFVA